MYIKIEPKNLGEEGVSWIFSSDGRQKDNLMCNQTFPECGQKIRFNKDYSITLTDPEYRNVGIYTCKVQSLAGRESETKTNYFPDLITHKMPENKNFMEGGNFEFDCKFEVTLLI